MVNSMAVAWILNTVQSNLCSTLTYADGVKKLRYNLEERFSVGNGPRIQQLKAQIANCKQSGQAVVDYYGKLKLMWDELVNYESPLAYKCRGCTCDLAGALAKKQEAEKIHQFLMGLDDSVFGTVISNKLSTDPLPSIQKVYSLIIQDERVRSVANPKENMFDVVAFAAARLFQPS